jgi:hypothetical protein
MAVGRIGSDRQTVGFLRKTVNYNDTGVATGVLMGYLPAGAHILYCSVHVRTAFNAGTTNVLTVGTAGGSNADIAGAATVTEGTPGYYGGVPVADIAYPTGDLAIYAQYTQTGTAATTGKADCVVAYVFDDALYN